jgi:hypothetical protein
MLNATVPPATETPVTVSHAAEDLAVQEHPEPAATRIVPSYLFKLSDCVSGVSTMEQDDPGAA